MYLTFKKKSIHLLENLVSAIKELRALTTKLFHRK